MPDRAQSRRHAIGAALSRRQTLGALLSGTSFMLAATAMPRRGFAAAPSTATLSDGVLTIEYDGSMFSRVSRNGKPLTAMEPADALRLADGTRLDFPDVMTLCAQCHGPQMTDYGHGAHGGMTGFWDKSRGPQEKLNCIDCHLPHTPQFPKMQPTFKPKDRFLSPEGGDH